VSFEYVTPENLLWKDDKEVSDEDEVSKIPNEEKVDRKTVLENFNLKIVGGEKIAFVGKSGSGKTTLVKLISGYMHPSGGKVLVDGQDLANVMLKSYYKYLGYLTQEPSVFDGTIKENMLYALGDEDLKLAKKQKRNLEQEMMLALERAQCDFVFKMAKGVETEIGEKGVRLSGGERQRLAIAKLFLKNPEIIILDEPTSALDSFSEDKIAKALDELFVGRTTIIIAHRLQTVKKADRILVIENGKIVEEGNHGSLVDSGGTYSKMLSMQGGLN
jgi:ABC-type multidrug transport system fused ATPase/permease subunit